MKRHEALHPLSHDHQNALARALRLRRVRDADAAERRAERTSFVSFATTRLEPHFAEEERLAERAVELCPRSAAIRAACDRLRDEHLLLRTAIDSLREPVLEPSGERLHEIGTLLTDHIRFEERQLFELLQQELGDRVEELVHA